MSFDFHCDQYVHVQDPVIDSTEYRHIIGSLLYLSTRSRPDITTAVSILSQFVAKPTQHLLRCAKRVLVYLHHTHKYGLVYDKQAECNKMEAWVDADYAGDQSDRKSRSGLA